MARKSKRHSGECDGGGVASLNTLYATAIYARLSVENSGKEDEGASIENQVDACREYVESQEDLSLYKVYEDNGWSGTKMDRPAWDEMMGDVKAGRVRAIVVRDDCVIIIISQRNSVISRVRGGWICFLDRCGCSLMGDNGLHKSFLADVIHSLMIWTVGTCSGFQGRSSW